MENIGLICIGFMRISEKELNKKFFVAYNEAREILKQHLLHICKKNHNINHILNTMGSTAFYEKDSGRPLWGHEKEELIGAKDFMKFMIDWDPIFHLTGDPLEIKNDKIIRG